jgi:hypothetical protein
MSITDVLGQAGHLLAAVAIGYGVLAAYRWIQRRSTVLAAIVAAGILARVGLGLTLFWISYLRLPILESLQAGNGFWELAVDARNYYNHAAASIAASDVGYDPLAPSPVFVWILALWMLVVGVTPAAAMFLNLCLYVALAVVIIRIFAPLNDWRRDLPCIVLLGAYSFSPVILIHSTQPMKDEVFNVLLAAACLGVLAMRRLMRSPAARQEHWLTAAGAVAMAVAIFGATGIRWYYGFIIWCALALLFGIFAIRGRTMPLPRYLAASFAVLLLAWLGFWAGSGRYYFLAADLTSAAKLMNITQLARIGFLVSGGGTNIVVPFREDLDAGNSRYAELLDQNRRFEGVQERVAAEQAYLAEHSGAPAPATASAAPAAAPAIPAATPATPAATPPAPSAPAPSTPPPPAEVDPAVAPSTRAVPIVMREHVIAAATGLAVVFVPISLLRVISDVEVEGGRGLLSIVDLDTVVLDIASLLVVGLLWKRRRSIGDRMPFVVFGLILAGTSALLLGYVVTNLGTLWRLRSLIVVPLWILAVALSPPRETARDRSILPEEALAG